jgi:hypothetical protein
VGGKRPQAHFEKFWFGGVTRVDAYMIHGSRRLPMAECLAIDLFDPRRNKVRSARQKWRTKCPVCALEKSVSRQLRDLFPLRKRR